jgi:uncharacterized protein
MSLFWKSERAARQLIEQYFRTCDETLLHFEEAMRTYLDGGDSPAFSSLDELTHRSESKADDLRVEVEKLLYTRTILPESRDDLLDLLEAFDRMPNLAETVIYMAHTQCIVVPPEFRERFAQLVALNVEAYRLARKTEDLLFSDPSHVGETVQQVDAKESEADGVEHRLVYDIFRSSLPRCEMMLLRELISRVGDIADSAEKVARRLEIMALKRRV